MLSRRRKKYEEGDLSYLDQSWRRGTVNPYHFSHRQLHPRTQKFFFVTTMVLFLFSVFGFRPLIELVVDSLRSTTFSKGVHSDLKSTDDFTTGKYCVHKKERWTCYECGDGSRPCQVIQGRSKCPQFRRVLGDYPVPRAQSDVSKENAGLPTRTLSWLGVRYYHEQPICTVAACFNLERCSDSVLKVFVDQNGEHPLLDYASEHSSPIGVERVRNAQDACLIVVNKDTYPSVDAMKNSGHWNNGENHLLWGLNHFPDRKIVGDASFNMFHVGKAIVASETLTAAHARLGYDIVLPLRRKWGRLAAPGDFDIHRPRKILLSFRGKLIDSIAPGYQHRWLAIANWEVANDVLVDVECWHFDWLNDNKVMIKPYDKPSSIYEDIIWNSTFGFAPGGSGVSSYRFAEVLSTAGIPVVVHGDFVPPLAPELDWSKCIIWVMEERIIDLPRILRLLSPEEVRARQAACWKLHEAVMGEREVDGKWHDDERVLFTKSLQIVAQRIVSAVQMSRVVNGFMIPR